MTDQIKKAGGGPGNSKSSGDRDASQERAIIEAVPEGEAKREKGTPAFAELADDMESAPPAIKRMFEFMSIGMTGMSPRHPLFDKFTDAHVDKYLDSLRSDDDHAYKLASTNRFFYLTVFGIVVGVLVFLVVFLLPENKELLYEILKMAAVFVGGLGSGIGIQVMRQNKSDQ